MPGREHCRAVTQLMGEGITASAARCDVTKKAEVERLVAWTAQQYGGVDILIANAGARSPAISVTLGLLGKATEGLSDAPACPAENPCRS